MATFLPKPFSSLISIFFLTFTSFTTTTMAKQPHRFAKTLNPNSLGFKKEKLSHLHFYFHDIVSGPNATAVLIVSPPKTKSSPTAFGFVAMMDDPLTLGPEPGSKLVGRAQGFYASASQEDLGLLMAVTFSFIDDKYNGSSLSILGRNAVFSKVREMPVIGGTGLFRLARGYAQAKTVWFNLTSRDAVVEYNVFVLHY